ncbi:MAG: SlyX family protein [Pseudobdellovibrio sp.]
MGYKLAHKTALYYCYKKCDEFRRMTNLEKQIIDLEIKASHFERTIEELSDVLFIQQKQIDQLEKTISLLNKKINAGLNAELEIGPANEKPPHY